MNLMSFTLVTPMGIFAREEISVVRVITPNGQIELLPGHCSYIGLVSEGGVDIVTSSGKQKQYLITEGSLECSEDKVVLLTDSVKVN
jgi:F0F1-type ATP synthase epsilon subunit